MAKPIETQYITGKVVYAILHNPNGQYWRADTKVFEAFNASNWAAYAITLTEDSPTAYYRGTYPPEITTVVTTDALYQRIGGSPATSDLPLGMGKSQGVNVSEISGALAATSNMSLAAGSEVQGAAIAGTLSQTQMSTNLINTLTGSYVGRSVIWTSGQLQNSAAGITAYDGSTKIMSFTPMPVAPINGDTFIIV